MSPPDAPQSDHALVPINDHLGPTDATLDVPWATFAGNRTDAYAFEIGGDEPRDGYVLLQAFEVGDVGHEIVCNGEPLPGFDIPPRDGWGLWMDVIEDGRLRSGENTLRIRRNADVDDAFAVGTAVVHWRSA